VTIVIPRPGAPDARLVLIAPVTTPADNPPRYATLDKC
jgi:hypothetical protein